MQHRTFFRIMMDNLLLSNPIGRTIVAFVNFCNEQSYFGEKKLKFFSNVPLSNNVKNSSVHAKFIFDSTKVSGINLK